VITFGPINAGSGAGDSIDIFVGDSFDRLTPGGPGPVHVHRANDGLDFVPDQYQRFFRPDCALPEHGGSPCAVY